MSTHEIPVIRLGELKDHPNADKLAITEVFGWTVCVGKADFQPGDLAAYIPPDFICPVTRPEFAFLGDHPLIRVKKLRGVVSQGLLIKADPSLKEGDNAIDFYGIKRYEPLDEEAGADNEPSPSGLYSSKYDVETFNRYNRLIPEGEPVVIREKLHGCSSRFVFASKENRMYCGSRTGWKKRDDANLWWQCLARNPWIEKWCREHPDMILYGECFGRVQNLKYGAGPQDVFFAVFDIMVKGNYLGYEESQEIGQDLVWAPTIYVGPFNLEYAKEAAEQNSSWPGAEQQMSEGVVVRPVVERTCPEIGRVQLKLVSNRYLEKS